MELTPHHVGICVTDLQQSLRFWCEGLGFETTMVPPVGTEWADALEIGGEVEFTAHFVKKGGFEFELLHYTRPEPHGQPSHSRKQLGFTHVAFDLGRDDDLDDVIDRLTELGGTVIPSTRTSIPNDYATVELVFMADPDGVRVELMKTTLKS